MRYGLLKFLTKAVCIFSAFIAVYEIYILDSDIFIDYLELSTASASWFLNLIGHYVERIASGWGPITKIIWAEDHSRLVVTSG